MNIIRGATVIFLFFGFASGTPIGPNNKLERDLTEEIHVAADKEIQDIVDQGVQDFEIGKRVFVFKQKMDISDKAHGTMVTPVYNKGLSSESYAIIYSPWKGSPETVQSKRPFLFNHDLASSISSCEDSFVRRDKPHPRTQKFELLHELAHIKNGDLDGDSYQNVRLKSNLSMMKLINIVGAAACLLFAWKSNSMPKTKCMVVAGIGFLANALKNNIYYHGFLANRRNQEFMADASACTLLYKNDPKPIVHWILDMSFERDYRTWEGKTDNPAENIGSTHPTHWERIELSFNILRNSGIVWTDQLYREIQNELDDDEHREAKLIYLNKMNQVFLMIQNKNPIPRAHQKEKYKKFFLKGVLEGYMPGALYQQIIKWKKR